MSRYSLMRGERVLWSSFPGFRYRLFVFIRDIALGVLLGFTAYFFFSYFNLDFGKYNVLVPLVLSFVGVLLGVYNQIILMLTRYTITNKRVIIKQGLLNRRLVDVKIENILDTKVEQKVNQLMLGCGNIYLFTANDSHDHDSFLQKTPRIENIDNPFQVHNLLKAAISESHNHNSMRYNAYNNDFEYGGNQLKDDYPRQTNRDIREYKFRNTGRYEYGNDFEEEKFRHPDDRGTHHLHRK